jgi:hypothetical protein
MNSTLLGHVNITKNVKNGVDERAVIAALSAQFNDLRRVHDKAKRADPRRKGEYGTGYRMVAKETDRNGKQFLVITDVDRGRTTVCLRNETQYL